MAAVRDGRLPRARLDAAATRMVALLLHVRHSDATLGRGSALPRGVSARLSAAALTSVSGPCSGRLVGGHVRVSGPADAVAAFRAAAARQGLWSASAASASRCSRRSTTGHRGPASWSRSTGPTYWRAADAPVRLATYGATAGAMDAAVGFLLGDRTAPGKLPVGVRGIPRSGC